MNMKAEDWITIGKMALAALPFLILCLAQIYINKSKIIGTLKNHTFFIFNLRN